MLGTTEQPLGTEMKYAALLSASLALGTCASSEARSVHGIRNVPFTIAGGQIVTLPIADNGPIGAENECAKILVAGFGIRPSRDNGKKAELLWGFDFEAKSLRPLEFVTVEEVSPSESPVVLVEDKSPSLKNGIWSGTAVPIPANRASTPWIFTDKQSIYVFRFTIKASGEAPFVLYQPTWFTVDAKMQFQHMIDGIERD